ALADQVVLAAVYQATNIPAEQVLHPEHIVQTLQAHGCQARQLPDVAAIVDHLTTHLRSGDVVAILSNGGFDGIYQRLPVSLRNNPGRA
ncbi:MAG: UDP-N-acetylmuramate:L-alanyl-gamma-D-glutamyl-meso-diaminopimelate ligase, partial [Acidobacteriaceae bacterium]